VSQLLGNLQNARDELIKTISRVLANQLRVLLEEKHIYQQIVVDAPTMIATWAASVHSMGPSVQVDDGEFVKQRFKISAQQAFAMAVNSVPSGPWLTLIVGNVKLFCSKCDEREVFSPVWFAEMGNESGQSWQPEELEPVIQLFAISFQCQRCKGQFEGVIVRREGWRIGLHGRSPMELVDVPKYIPKEERNLFRDAMIAAHGGKILAALFYLRVFTEQFARRVTGETGRRYGDELMEEYGKTLPDPHRSTMPSLREWYEKLSEPIHAAKEDEKLFEEAREAIEKHFEIRKVFRISEFPGRSAVPISGSPPAPK
jgi:hypothetical protein